jgi:hypothetical protein
MKNRFLEIYDKNGIPVYENDSGFLDFEELSKRTSLIGKLIKNNYENRLIGEIHFQNSFPEVKTAFTLKFKREDGSYLKRKDYFNSFPEDLESLRKKDIEVDLEETYVLKNSDSSFTRYLLGAATLELIDVNKEERSNPIVEKDSELFLSANDTKYAFDHYILFEKNDAIAELLKEEFERAVKGDYTHVCLELSKKHGFHTHFRYYFSNEKGEETCHLRDYSVKPEYQEEYERKSEEYDEIDERIYQEKRKAIKEIKNISKEKREEINAFYMAKLKEETKSVNVFLKDKNIYNTRIYENLTLALGNTGNMKAFFALSERTNVICIPKKES